MKNEKIKRFSPFRFYFINIFLFVVIVVMTFIMVSLFFFPLGEVEVKGTTIYSATEIQEKLLNHKYDDNTVFAFLRSKFTKHKNIEFIESYSFSIKNPRTIRITIKEKELYGYVNGEDEKYVYYDSEGIVLENSKRFVGEHFFVEGLTAKKAKVGDKLPVGDTNVKTILTIQEAFADLGIDASSVTFSEDGTITFYVGAIFVNLGTRSSLTEKLNRLPYILPQLEGKVGTLHLEEWTEENTDIVFEESTQ